MRQRKGRRVERGVGKRGGEEDKHYICTNQRGKYKEPGSRLSSPLKV